ncbi:MAG UNVERIFIED_CONTAM: hypothetical protein LVR18_11165 [Planctomycetaceae bacterium]
MDAFLQLVTSILQLLQAILQVLLSLINVAIPWLPLLAWIGFWGLAVNWTKAFPILRRGGYFGVLLLMFAAVLVWGSVAPRRWPALPARAVRQQLHRQVSLCHHAHLYRPPVRFRSAEWRLRPPRRVPGGACRRRRPWTWAWRRTWT